MQTRQSLRVKDTNPLPPFHTPAEQQATKPRPRPTHPAALIQRAAADPRSMTRAETMQLQRTVGNRAVGRLLAHTIPRQQKQESENRTGLPDRLKAGIECLSGLDMSEVLVHYNSAKPSGLQALAYTQGKEIHVGPGQEKHLSHEAWHVVQQAQGRVLPTMQLKEKILVNDDKGLEHEAEVMGARAADFAHLTPPSQRSQGAGFGSYLAPMLTSGDGSHIDSVDVDSGAKTANVIDAAARTRGNQPIVQRTIWKYANRKWEVAEVGTTGQYEKPKDPTEGLYFNDVNNKSGKDIEEVRAGLLDRMLQTGSVEALGQGRDWQTLANELVNLSRTTFKSDLRRTGGLLTVGVIRLKNTDGRVTGATVTNREVPDKVANHVKEYILKFMRKNGQLDYIERQPWFKDGSNAVDVDLNFYFNRPMGESGELAMHKDTAGDNLFVNIIFDNKQETPATEWTQDRKIPEGDKKSVMEKLMPPGMISAITRAKKDLEAQRVRVGGHNTIEGGTLPKYGYVSWVDELIWHSTPTLAKRQYYTGMVKYLFEHLEEQDNINVYEAMLLLKEQKGTWIHQTVEGNKEKLGSLFSQAAWRQVLKYAQELGYINEIKKDIKGYQWGEVKWSGRSGEETDTDQRGLSTKSRVPTEVTGRGRANSVDATLKRVKEAAKNQPRRSFLRTWVRVGKAK